MRGILINNTLHTGRDLNLVMTSKALPAPKVQTFTVSVPGRNGLLDLSEALTGEVAYDNRTLKFTFVGDGSREYVLSLIDKFLTYHGQYITVTTDDYPEWYYTGRADVTYNDKGFYAEITLTVDAQPFRYRLTPTEVIYTPPANETIIVTNPGKPVIPTITVGQMTKIDYGGGSYTLWNGTYNSEEFKLATGDNEFYIGSKATVTISFIERAI